jgi:hypothetical protein
MAHHQEQMGSGFLFLRVKIPALWLVGWKNPQEGLIKNAKGHSNMVGTVYSTWQNMFLWSPPQGRTSSPIYAIPPGHPGTLFNRILLNKRLLIIGKWLDIHGYKINK